MASEVPAPADATATPGQSNPITSPAPTWLPARLVRFWWWLGGIAGAGLLWRLLYILTAKRPVDACGGTMCGDALYYVLQASANANGDWFDDPANPGSPAADHPPLTAVLLTPAGLFTGREVTMSRLIMALVGTAVIVVLGLVGRRLGGDTVGVVAAALAAVNPNLWMNDALPMSEAPAALALGLVFLATYRLAVTPTLGWAVAAGLACGLAVTARGELALLVPLTVAPVVVFGLRSPALRALRVPRRLVLAVVVGAVGVAVVAPWTVWNTVRFSEPVALSTNDGLTLIGANCESVYDGGGVGFWDLDCALDLAGRIPDGADQAERSAVYRDEAVAFIRDNLDRLPAVAAVRMGRVWGVYAPDQMAWLNQGEGRERWASWLGMVFWWGIAPVAAAGVAVGWRHRLLTWPLVSSVAVVTITAVAFYGIVRFRLPADVAAMPLAALAVVAARRWVAGRRQTSRPDGRPGPETDVAGAGVTGGRRDAR
jgi:4-amino-4-deoxy-L-arabinose transferase-like glycosyltransferase